MGETPRAAEGHANDSFERAFPAGTPTPKNAVFDLVNDPDDIAGYLWIGRDNSGDDTCRAEGARTLGLSVFGFNAVARAMYESVGYETTSLKMRKQL
jgi:hypothetical protein